MQPKLLLYFFVFLNLIVNNHFRGTRIHLYPLMTGFSLYSLALLFGIFEEISFYYYYLTTLVTMVIAFFFGTVDYYQSFETSGRYKAACVESVTKASGNRLFIYYPTDKKTDKQYNDMKWAYDGDHMIKGLMRFAADILPSGPFYYLLSVKQNVRVNAPIAKLPENDKH